MFAGTQFGRYEIRSKIGEGGMGEVYVARDPELDRPVAIKLLPREFSNDQERQSRFRQEARVVSALNHPNIITIYEVGENEHGSFLATEFVEGTTLREILKREVMTLPRILRIIEQAANALVAAHTAGIIHRDVKPENIMIREDAIVKVLDFGLAKPKFAIAEGLSSENMTIPGTVMGSARYMSPEQARGLEVDERTDIWSLGVVLYEMLMGSAPFEGETTADTIAAVVYKEPEPIAGHLPNVPPELIRIVRKALQKDREERYQNIKDLALDIKELAMELEHANSGERSGHSTSSPGFSENPTMLHHTVSGGSPAVSTRASFASGGHVLAASRERSSFVRIGAAVLGVAVMAAAAFGFYNWYGQTEPMAHGAFIRPQISRINTDGKVNNPAISPDGKYIAYVSGEIGNRSLVVRQISTDSIVTIVPQTNLNLHSVSFAPDGEHVYFCQTRSDFAVNTLYQVPTLGGTPRKLIEDVDSTVTFSPDGRQFAFMRHVSSTNEDLYFIANSATLESEKIISSKDTGYDFLSARPSWSPDGRRILVGAGKREGGFVSRMAVGEIDVVEKSFRVLNADRFFTVGGFKWLPDGSGFLVTARESQNGPAQIWKNTYPLNEFRQVTNDFNDYVEVGLADDGRTIVSLKVDTIGSIWRVSPNGQDRHQITTENRNTEGASGLAEGPDGRIVFTRNEGNETDLWVADREGRSPQVVIDVKGWAVAPVFTPDKRSVIFNLQRDKTSRIWKIDADGKNAVQLSDDDPNVVDFNPQVTPDGRWIIFQRASIEDHRGVLMRMPVTGGPAEVFFGEDDWSIFMPRLSPDGKRIAYMTYNLHTWEKKLKIAAIENDRFARVERDLDNNLVNQYQWSPDSRSVTAVTSRGGIQNLWRLPIDGSQPTQMTSFQAGRVLNFAWSADKASLLISRGNTNNDLILIRDQDRMADREAAARGPNGVRRTRS